MKKSRFTKLIAVVLALTLAFSSFGAVTVGAASTYSILDSENPAAIILSGIVDAIFRFVLDWFANLFGNGPGFVDKDVATELAGENFYEGIGKEFVSEAEDDAKWNIGYANETLIPEDYDNGEYYIGGYIAPENGFTNVVEGIAQIPGIGRDDMKVRCIAINDGTDKGTVLFATVDCIGITNADIKDIRALLADFAAANNIVSINVASTHTHSCIDTEGLWTKNIYKLISNGVISGTKADEELQQGTNPEYMAFLKETVADTLKAAFINMQPGVLTYSTKDIGQDYFQNKNRPSSGEMVYEDEVFTGETKIAMTDITRFVFTPDDETEKKTMILNIAAHPDVAGLPTDSNSGREISGDYVFYCGQFLEKYGYNFMFFQGAIAGIYMARTATGDNVETQQRVEESQRFGYELARILLSMNLTEEEILTDDLLSNRKEVEENTKLVSIYNEDGTIRQEFEDFGFSFIEGTTSVQDANGNVYEDYMMPYNPGYTTWYENWEAVEEVVVAPYLNLYLKQVEIPITSSLIQAIGKLNMANYVVIANEDGTYSTITEIGYMEIGDQFKTVFLPGEICQDLVAPNGISLLSKYSITGKAYESKAACEIFGDDIQCFGLMNDAIGYVVPDNDYTMGDPANHYHELISLGQYVASGLMDGLEELKAEIDAR